MEGKISSTLLHFSLKPSDLMCFLGLKLSLYSYFVGKTGEKVEMGEIEEWKSVVLLQRNVNLLLINFLAIFMLVGVQAGLLKMDIFYFHKRMCKFC